MTLLSAGITVDVMRDSMKPYHLGADMLESAVTILPAPPRDASAAWRHARLTRLVREVSVLSPADDGQGRLAMEIVVFREMSDDTFHRSNAAGLTVEQVCRVRRAAADLTRTAGTMVRELRRWQLHPVPFFGTALADQVDIAALDAVWCKSSSQQAGAPEPVVANGFPSGACHQACPGGELDAGVVPVGPEPEQPDPTGIRSESEANEAPGRSDPMDSGEPPGMTGIHHGAAPETESPPAGSDEQYSPDQSATLGCAKEAATLDPAGDTARAAAAAVAAAADLAACEPLPHATAPSMRDDGSLPGAKAAA